jgi:hypothetical protein
LWLILMSVAYRLEKNACSSLFGWSSLLMSIQLTNVVISYVLPYFSPLDLSIFDKKTLKSSTTILNSFISPWSSISFCLMYFYSVFRWIHINDYYGYIIAHPYSGAPRFLSEELPSSLAPQGTESYCWTI